jgi:hypothetical protein
MCDVAYILQQGTKKGHPCGRPFSPCILFARLLRYYKAENLAFIARTYVQ